MREKVFISLVIIVFSGTSTIGQQIVRSESKGLTVCDTVAAPEKYVDKETRFTAVFQSGFMVPQLLGHPACDGVLVESSTGSEDKTSKDLGKKISRNFKDDSSGIFSTGKFIFTGILTKAATPRHTPIKGVLQNY